MGQAGRAGRAGQAGRIAVAAMAMASVVSGVPPALRVLSAELRRDRAEARSAEAGSRTVVAAEQQPPPKPSFQATVEVTSVDVTVVDDRGKPVANLTPADFNVRIDGGQRRVVSAEWIPLAAQ